MNSYESMKKKHEQTGLYCVTDNSNISCELKAYAVGLDVLYDTLKEIERECFVETAEDYGLSAREEFLGYNRQELDIADRRRLICAAEQITGECTVEAFRKMLEGYGLADFSITQRYSQNTAVIYVYDNLTDSQKAKLESRINEDFPIHLTVNVYYTSH